MALGEMWGIGVLFFCFVILAAFTLIVPMSNLIDSAREILDCNNTNIGLGEKMTCLAFDLYIPYFVLIVIFAALAYIIFKTGG